MSLTLTEAMRGFILADPTLASKVNQAVYPSVLSSNPPDNAAVIKLITNNAWSSMDGATDQTDARIEVTFWSKIQGDAERSANRFRSIVKSFNGTMGTGGIKMTVYKTMGPRTLFSDDAKFHGCQVDVLAIVDMGTAA